MTSRALLVGVLLGAVWAGTPPAARPGEAAPPVGWAGEAPPPARPDAQELARAPDFALVDVHGDKLRLSELRGKIVVLHFWAEWCASCKVDLRYFQSAHETYADSGVVVLGLAYASGDRDEVRRFTEELGVRFPTVICDEDTREAYQVAALPTNVVVDRQGRIRAVSRRLMHGSYWDDLLQRLIAEGPVT